MRKTVGLVIAGALLGALLSRSTAVEAASQLMFGSYANVAKAVVVTSAGYVIVHVN